ncbi:hypothetical protein [Flavobacterium sedimenticola]|uniref:Response regulatory domain-containing protein n=1 Tax=Flavobacterium sedimenticola TaxID=3043286 RepID=A0ABT6XSW7_9FLAO|nr:hypothetical protein [Flavobacterium sedimenticola]MDI9258188.1 hypothetical protein [Flavobacterium sedimenticola]
MAAIIKVLLVDDKEDYCQSLVGVGRLSNLNIVYRLDWETGFEVLTNNPSIEFVILDGKGKIEEDQEVEKDNFVFKAIKDITQWSEKNKKHIPYCVNTGFIERFEALDGNARIFQKTEKDRGVMFQFIKDEIAQSHYRTLRMSYDEAFAPFDLNIMAKTHEPLLIEIITVLNNTDYAKKNLNVQRDLLEAVFKSLNNPIPCIPTAFFDATKKNKPNLESCTRFMEDRDTNGHKLNKPVPQSIKSAFRKLKESTSEYSHLSDEATLKLPFLSNTFLLMEILEWLPEFVKKHYPNYI